MNLKQMLDKRGSGQAAPLLNGSDVPVGTNSITIVVAGIRESPEGFTAPAIIDLKKPVYGKSAWAVNKTNMKAIIKRFGDDATKLVGQKIRLEVVQVLNPQSGEIVRSLAVSPRQYQNVVHLGLKTRGAFSAMNEELNEARHLSPLPYAHSGWKDQTKRIFQSTC
jgi:hypothetical protein